MLDISVTYAGYVYEMLISAGTLPNTGKNLTHKTEHMEISWLRITNDAVLNFNDYTSFHFNDFNDYTRLHFT